MPSRTKKSSSTRRSKSLEMARQYQLVVRWSDEDECFLAWAPALQGCMTHGETAEEATRNGLEVVSLWLEEALKHGDHIPKPAGRGYSGKMTLRMPTSLHRRIAEEAEREGVSINQLVLHKLAKAV